MWVSLLDGSGNSRYQAAPSYGYQDVGDVRHLFQDLKPDRSLSRHYQMIVERMNEQRPAFPACFDCRSVSFVEVFSGEYDLCTVVPGGKDLLRRCAFGHKDRCFHAEKVGRKSDPLRVIPGRCRDHAIFQGILGLRCHEVHGAADLERSGPLEVLAFEPERYSDSFAEVVRVDELGPPDPLFQTVGGFVYEGIIESSI